LAHLTITNLTVRYAAGTPPAVADLSLEVQPGELVALLGPSGSGKSSTLRCVAGFLQPDCGDITLDDQSILDVAPERRSTALVFQQPTLFPHLSVIGNVAFGLQMQGVSKQERRRLAATMLDAVQMADYSERRPSQLSGGQQQRVALARALVTQPRVLLLDEPFAALDPALRDEMRLLVRRLQHEHNVTTLLVTHDQQEAALLADRVALLIDGRLQQVAPPETFYARPASLAVARFFGAQNFLPGELQSDQYTVRTALGPLTIAHNGLLPGPVTLMIRPEHVRLHQQNGNGIRGRVAERHFLGTLYRYHITTGATSLTALTPDASFAPGDQVEVALPPEHVWALSRTED
jgi:ABC-type Fe3+/spermidine/putrescine transport system ATPase subunit